MSATPPDSGSDDVGKTTGVDEGHVHHHGPPWTHSGSQHTLKGVALLLIGIGVLLWGAGSFVNAVRGHDGGRMARPFPGPGMMFRRDGAGWGAGHPGPGMMGKDSSTLPAPVPQTSTTK